MEMLSLSTRMKQKIGKLWRTYIVDECPDEKWERLQQSEIYYSPVVVRPVSIQVPLRSYHNAGFFKVSIAS